MIQQFILPAHAIPAAARSFIRPGDLALDIETTGLSAGRDHIYCIGTAELLAEEIRVTQFLALTPAEEPEILSDFAKELHAKRIITYNGQTFDLPFLKKRFAVHGLNEPSLLSDPDRHLDLFRVCRPLKDLLSLPDTRQKTVEALLGLAREDRLSGKELIRVYQRLQTPGSRESQSDDLELLSLHNREDVAGLFSLLSMFSYQQLSSGSMTIEDCFPEGKADEQLFCVRVRIPDAIPVPVQQTDRFGTWRFREHQGIFQFPVHIGPLRHYFPDFKNYYYLPAEDRVIHKSIGQFVDRNFREKAAKENCYVEKQCSYLFLPEKSTSGYYQKDLSDRSTYLELPEALTENGMAVFPANSDKSDAATSGEPFLQQLNTFLRLRMRMFTSPHVTHR